MKRMLYAEDHKLVRKSTARLLTSLGWEVTSVENGEEASECLKQGHGYEIVVSDIMMPKLTGVQLANLVAIRYPDLPVLLVSGNPEELELFKGELPQKLELLLKPFSTDELQQALSSLTSSCKANQ